MRLNFAGKDFFNNETEIILYINELPFELPQEYRKKYIEIGKQNYNIKIKDKQLCLEIYKKKDHSNYALLGCKYINTGLPLQVEINMFETNEKYYTPISCIDWDKKYKGIKEEYIDKIKEGVLNFFKNKGEYFLARIVKSSAKIF